MAQPFLLAKPVRIRPGLTVALYLSRKTARASHTLLRSPAVWILATVLAGSSIAVRALPWLVFVLIPWGVLSLAYWAMQFPEGFRAHIVGRLYGSVRSLLAYRWRWTWSLKRCGIITRWQDTPLLLRTWSTPTIDRLRVRMVAGQESEDYAAASGKLAQTFGALGCRITNVPGRPHWLDLMFITRDSLVKVVTPYPPEPDALTKGLRIARGEDGRPWRLNLLGNHLLVVGATGSGKSSVIWSVIDALLPFLGHAKPLEAKAVRESEPALVKLWVLDYKGGMELAAGSKHFARFVYDDRLAKYADTLEAAVRIMKARQGRLHGVTRQHVPSAEEPLIVVLIDEMADLLDWSADREAQKRVKAALSTLLRQGRAVGVSVIGAVQDPRKDVIPMRGLFTIRVAMRLNETREVDMVLGRGALEAGAKCHQIPRSQQGVGFVAIDGVPTPQRVRFAHVTDEMIRDFKWTPAELMPVLEEASVGALPPPALPQFGGF